MNNGISGDIGILSIDVDGNDYWIWEAIDCISPRIVICEYNALFGKNEKVSVPYKPDFVWTKEHFSNLYWGASLAALEYLSEKKGYVFVGVNKAGNNAFFVKEEFSKNLSKTTTKKEHIYSSFRQSRNEKGELTCLDEKKCLTLLSNCILQKVDTLEKASVQELFGENNEL